MYEIWNYNVEDNSIGHDESQIMNFDSWPEIIKVKGQVPKIIYSCE